eukprot:1522389-Prymnesium_polylepis.2
MEAAAAGLAVKAAAARAVARTQTRPPRAALPPAAPPHSQPSRRPAGDGARPAADQWRRSCTLCCRCGRTVAAPRVAAAPQHSQGTARRGWSRSQCGRAHQARGPPPWKRPRGAGSLCLSAPRSGSSGWARAGTEIASLCRRARKRMAR